MSRIRRWYGASPLHLLTMIGCLALAGYAVAKLVPSAVVGVPVWLIGAVIGHDLVLVPLYTLADRSVTAVLRHRPPDNSTGPPGASSTGPWINYSESPPGCRACCC